MQEARTGEDKTRLLMTAGREGADGTHRGG